MEAKEPEVLSRLGNSIALATLNRPKALNSLNTNMVTELYRLYRQWDADERVACIVLTGAGDKAFCAGGDVKWVVQQAMAQNHEPAIQFFRAEYTLNYELAVLHKPHVALLDGITMGGGAGVSMHGRFRVATERTVFAMPECGIGLFPDVGAAHFLNRLPGELGMYLALTGARLKGRQVKEAQLATHYVPSARLPQLTAALEQLRPATGGGAAVAASEVDRVIASFEDAAPGAPELAQQLPHINRCFGAESVEAVYEALRQQGGQWAQDTLRTLEKSSPLSQKITFRHMRQGRGASVADVLRDDFRLVYHMLRGESDFVEGVRALLIDKDGAPRWRPPRLEQVTAEMVAAFFRPLPPEQELQLPPAVPASRSRL